MVNLGNVYDYFTELEALAARIDVISIRQQSAVLDVLLKTNVISNGFAREVVENNLQLPILPRQCHKRRNKSWASAVTIDTLVLAGETIGENRESKSVRTWMLDTLKDWYDDVNGNKRIDYHVMGAAISANMVNYTDSLSMPSEQLAYTLINEMRDCPTKEIAFDRIEDILNEAIR